MRERGCKAGSLVHSQVKEGEWGPGRESLGAFTVLHDLLGVLIGSMMLEGRDRGIKPEWESWRVSDLKEGVFSHSFSFLSIFFSFFLSFFLF